MLQKVFHDLLKPYVFSYLVEILKGEIPKSSSNVRTVVRNVWQTFVGLSGSNRSAFYLYMATSAALAATLCCAHNRHRMDVAYLRYCPYPETR